LSDPESTASAEELLKRAPLFSRLSRRNLQKLAELSVPRSYPAGETVIEEGSTGLGLFIITSGRLEIFKDEGDSRATVAVMEPGDILGEMALIDDQPRSASAVTLEPTSCLLITRSSFQTLVNKEPEIAMCIVTPLAERLRELQQRIIDSGGLILGDQTDHARSEPDQADAGDEAIRDDTEAEGSQPLLLQALRAQYALTMAGVTGMKSSVKVMESFFSSLAGTTKLSKSDDLGGVLRKLPEALIEATGAALGEVEKLPERIISRYRREWP
jgi:CRP-like cAMP-binding protein